MCNQHVLTKRSILHGDSHRHTHAHTQTHTHTVAHYTNNSLEAVPSRNPIPDALRDRLLLRLHAVHGTRPPLHPQFELAERCLGQGEQRGGGRVGCTVLLVVAADELHQGQQTGRAHRDQPALSPAHRALDGGCEWRRRRRDDLRHFSDSCGDPARCGGESLYGTRRCGRGRGVGIGVGIGVDGCTDDYWRKCRCRHRDGDRRRTERSLSRGQGRRVHGSRQHEVVERIRHGVPLPPILQVGWRRRRAVAPGSALAPPDNQSTCAAVDLDFSLMARLSEGLGLLVRTGGWSRG